MPAEQPEHGKPEGVPLACAGNLARGSLPAQIRLPNLQMPAWDGSAQALRARARSAAGARIPGVSRWQCDMGLPDTPPKAPCPAGSDRTSN